VWLYVPTLSPSTSSASAPASEDLNSASSSPSTPWECRAEESLTWRGSAQPPQAWLRRWKQGGFIRLLSGLICEPSTADAGVDSFISSLREIPAKTTALPESALGPMASGSLPPKSAALPPKAGLILSSERTSRGTRTDSLKPSSQHWKHWAIALRQEYSRRPKPATPCGASDCSSWPAASVMDTADSTDPAKIAERRARHKARGINGNGFGVSLDEAAMEWRTPSDISKRGGSQAPEKRLAGGHTVNLEDQAGHWPGPAARDHKGANSADHLEKSSGSLHLDQLPNFVEHCLPPSFPAQPTADGSTCSTASPNSNQPSAKRKLNPIFVEALMRWPTGLSGFERQETAWTQWWQLQRSYLSALDWGSLETAVQHDLFG